MIAPSAISLSHVHKSFGTVTALAGVDLDIVRGESLGLVGESGSGKSVTSTAILRLLPELAEGNPGALEGSQPFENIQWMSVLKSLTAYQMYRRAVQVRVRRPDVLRFLFQERRFPRSFYHTVCEAETCLENLPHNEKPRKAVTRVKNKVMRAKPESLSQTELHEFIDQLQLGLARVHDAIAESYFRARRPTETP